MTAMGNIEYSLSDRLIDERSRWVHGHLIIPTTQHTICIRTRTSFPPAASALASRILSSWTLLAVVCTAHHLHRFVIQELTIAFSSWRLYTLITSSMPPSCVNPPQFFRSKAFDFGKITDAYVEGGHGSATVPIPGVRHVLHSGYKGPHRLGCTADRWARCVSCRLEPLRLHVFRHLRSPTYSAFPTFSGPFAMGMDR